MKIFIGCSSRDNIPSKYYRYCKVLLKKLFEDGHDLVFGACSKGLMGLAYNIALDNNSDIIGVYPEVYKDEVKELQCFEMPVGTVNERTEKVIEQSDVLIFLPGGIGTVYEFFTAIESKRAGEHDKPIIVYDCCGFYDNLFLQLDKMYDDNFTSLEDGGKYNVCSDLENVLKCLTEYINKIDKTKIREK